MEIKQSLDGLRMSSELGKRGITPMAVDSVGNTISIFKDSMKKWMRKYKIDIPEPLK